MKQLKENGGIERSLLLTMAVIAGLTVANCYYNQPLLEMIRHDIGVSQHEANLITVVTQIGYAFSLFFLIPMGDLYSRRRIIVVNMTVAAIMAVVIAVANKVWIIWGASLLLGACSVIPQFFIPIAGQYSEQKNKSKNMGIVLSGLLTGILASRVVSGCWRMVRLARNVFHSSSCYGFVHGSYAKDYATDKEQLCWHI